MKEKVFKIFNIAGGTLSIAGGISFLIYQFGLLLDSINNQNDNEGLIVLASLLITIYYLIPLLVLLVPLLVISIINKVKRWNLSIKLYTISYLVFALLVCFAILGAYIFNAQ